MYFRKSADFDLNKFVKVKMKFIQSYVSTSSPDAYVYPEQLKYINYKKTYENIFLLHVTRRCLPYKIAQNKDAGTILFTILKRACIFNQTNTVPKFCMDHMAGSQILRTIRHSCHCYRT